MSVNFLSATAATGVTKVAITAAPAVLPTGGKDVPFQALAPKELRNVTGNPKACWIVSSDFADGEL